MKVQISDLRRAANALFDHLEQTGRTEIEVTEDFYWNIPEKHLYSVYTSPPEAELTMGQLSDDWNEVTKIASGQRPPTAYALVAPSPRRHEAHLLKGRPEGTAAPYKMTGRGWTSTDSSPAPLQRETGRPSIPPGTSRIGVAGLQNR